MKRTTIQTQFEDVGAFSGDVRLRLTFEALVPDDARVASEARVANDAHVGGCLISHTPAKPRLFEASVQIGAKIGAKTGATFGEERAP